VDTSPDGSPNTPDEYQQIASWLTRGTTSTQVIETILRIPPIAQGGGGKQSITTTKANESATDPTMDARMDEETKMGGISLTD
jgi:hypothetical protein